MAKIWRLSSIGLGSAALAAGLTVAATQAGATTLPRPPVTQSHHMMDPAACTTNRNYLGSHVTFTYCTGNKSRTGCSIGNNGAISGPLYAANGCVTQLFLWLTHTTSGTPDLCVNPQRSTNSLKRYYEEFKVSNQTGNCG